MQKYFCHFSKIRENPTITKHHGSLNQITRNNSK